MGFPMSAYINSCMQVTTAAAAGPAVAGSDDQRSALRIKRDVTRENVPWLNKRGPFDMQAEDSVGIEDWDLPEFERINGVVPFFLPLLAIM